MVVNVSVLAVGRSRQAVIVVRCGRAGAGQVQARVEVDTWYHSLRSALLGVVALARSVYDEVVLDSSASALL